MDIEKLIQKKYNLDFKESLLASKVLLTGQSCGVYNPHYKTHIAQKEFTIKEGETIDDVKKRLDLDLHKKNNFLTQVKEYDLYHAISDLVSGKYRDRLFKESGTTDIEKIKKYACKLHSFNDKKYSDWCPYIENDEIKKEKTNLATFNTNGFIFFDFDFPKVEENPNYVSEQDKPEAVEALKDLLYENLKQYNWFVFDCKSTRANGVHVYTYNLIPNDLDFKERTLYWQNCYQIMESIIIEVIGKERLDLMDGCSKSVAQGVNLSPADTNPHINENYRLRPNALALSLALQGKHYSDEPDAKYVKTIFNKNVCSDQLEVAPKISIKGMPSLEKAPFYFGTRTSHDGVPTLGVIICFLLYYYGLDTTLYLAKHGLYKKPQLSSNESYEKFRAYAENQAHKELYQPKPYVCEWAKENLGVDVEIMFPEYKEEGSKFLQIGEYASKYMLDDLEAVNSAPSIHTAKIIVAPGGGKTEATKMYAQKHNIDIIVPYNSVITNKYDSLYSVTSADKNPYDCSQSCVMIPDQWVLHSQEIDKEMCIIDEIHLIWSEVSYRPSCEVFLKNVCEKYKKVVFLTGTPTGEDEIIKPDVTLNYYKELQKKDMQWYILSSLKKDTVKPIIEAAIETSDFVGIYANRAFTQIEGMLREMEMSQECKPFIYASSPYRNHNETEKLIHSHLITDRYQGVLYTKYLGVGQDIDDTGKVTVIAFKTDQETGADIQQAAARFRNADISLIVLEIAKPVMKWNSTDELVKYANSHNDNTLERVIADGMLYNDKSVSLEGDRYIVNEYRSKSIDSINRYNNMYTERNVAAAYLTKAGFVDKGWHVFVEAKGEKIKAAFRDEDDAFISKNITELLKKYQERKKSSVMFDDFMRMTEPGDANHIEEGVFYVHNISYALSVLRKLNKIVELGVSSISNISTLTAFNPDRLKALCVFLSWHSKLKDLPSDELERIFDLDTDSFKLNFYREVLGIIPEKYTAKNAKITDMQLKCLDKNYNKVLMQLHSIFRLHIEESSSIKMTNEEIVQMLADEKDLLKNERYIKQREKRGTRVINLETKVFYNSIREACEKENIRKDKLMQLAAQGKYKIEPKEKHIGKQLMNTQTKIVYDSIKAVCLAYNQSEYLVKKAIKEGKFQYINK